VRENSDARRHLTRLMSFEEILDRVASLPQVPAPSIYEQIAQQMGFDPAHPEGHTPPQHRRASVEHKAAENPRPGHPHNS
jgi:hypothetical protein